MKPQVLHDTTREELSRFELTNYVMGSSMIKAKPNVTLDHFDQIQKVRQSTCPKKGGKYIHAIGWRALEKQFTLLILKERTKRLDSNSQWKRYMDSYDKLPLKEKERLNINQEFFKNLSASIEKKQFDLFSLGLNEYSEEELNEYKNQINWHE